MGVPDQNTRTYHPRYEQIAEDLASFILLSGLQAGERLPTEIEFGARFGVSRAIVHDAIKLLTASGLVQTRRGSGLFVGDLPVADAAPVRGERMIAPERMHELFEFRRDIEALTTQLACERINVAELRDLQRILDENVHAAEHDDREAFLATDTQFHQGIAVATHNAFYIETVATILRSQRWAVRLVTGGAPGSLSASAAQHHAICDAITAGQAEAAADAARTHIDAVFHAYQAAAHRRLTGEDRQHQQADLSAKGQRV